MGRKGHQARILNGGLDHGRLQVIEARKFHAVISNLFDLLHGARKVLLGVITDRVDLHGNWQCFLGKVPPVSFHCFWVF